MRPRPRAFLIAACATSILLSGCKSRRDDSEAKSVSAFNYSNPADPKQSLLFIFPASARSFASAQNGGPGRNGAEPVVESTNAPITVADLMAGLKAGTMSKAVEA